MKVTPRYLATLRQQIVEWKHELLRLQQRTGRRPNKGQTSRLHSLAALADQLRAFSDEVDALENGSGATDTPIPGGYDDRWRAITRAFDRFNESL